MWFPEVVWEAAKERGLSRAQIALTWVRPKPVVVAPIAGALKTSHVDEAIAAFSITLTYDEAT